MVEYKSNRLLLRIISISDITDRVMQWFEDDELMKYYSNSRNRITKESLTAAIEEGQESRSVFTFGIFNLQENILIGTLKLGPINYANMISDLVILIGDREFHGKGLAVEAIELGNRLAFERFDIRKLFGGMYESNISSIKAYTRAGWLVEGRLKGHYFVNGNKQDRILVGCFNPKYFSDDEIELIKSNEDRYFQNIIR